MLCAAFVQKLLDYMPADSDEAWNNMTAAEQLQLLTQAKLSQPDNFSINPEIKEPQVENKSEPFENKDVISQKEPGKNTKTSAGTKKRKPTSLRQTNAAVAATTNPSEASKESPMKYTSSRWQKPTTRTNSAKRMVRKTTGLNNALVEGIKSTDEDDSEDKTTAESHNEGATESQKLPDERNIDKKLDSSSTIAAAVKDTQKNLIDHHQDQPTVSKPTYGTDRVELETIQNKTRQDNANNKQTYNPFQLLAESRWNLLSTPTTAALNGEQRDNDEKSLSHQQ